MSGHSVERAGRRRATLGSLAFWNGLYALAVYLGFFEGWTYLAWLVTGLTVLMVICYVAVLVSPESRRKFVGYGHPVPVWALHLFDVTMVAALASRGAYFTAAMYALSALALRAIETDFWRCPAARNS